MAQLTPPSPAETSTIAYVDPHAEWRWDQRSGWPGYNLWAAWHEAAPVDYPSTHNDAYARYHAPTNTILIAEYGWLTTCIDLSDRPLSEQQYVRDQLSTTPTPHARR